jgi:hypothetical protein
MRRSVQIGLGAWLAWASLALAQGQVPVWVTAPAPPAPVSSGQPGLAIPPNPAPKGRPAEDASLPALQQDLDRQRRELQQFQDAQVRAQDAREGERLQKQVELLQKQIEVLQKMIDLLAEQARKSQAETATLDARSRQAARRDQELAGAVDDLREETDYERRWGPRLPATLKELFLPSQTNESPLSIYGFFALNYRKFEATHGVGEFEFQEFSPYFLLQLNERLLMEVELGFDPGGVEIGQAQADYLATDWLTVVAGRFRVPLGFFNERQHPAWINKLPDFPLMFRQVSPADFSLNGVQLRGATYLGCSPVKLEYAVYAANGLGLPEESAPAPGEKPMNTANLNELQETSAGVNQSMAYGGRVGFWVPELGLTAGFSTLFNTAYTDQSANDISVWQLDAGWHQGGWDVRLEYASLFQEALPLQGNDIRRQGLYAQVAYRPCDAACEYLRNTEMVVRYGYTHFRGIDPASLDVSAFPTPVDLPVGRNQYTFGVNYYFYPSAVLKLAYEINDETGKLNLHDNVFLAQFAWGF